MASCATRPPDVEMCSIVNIDTAECTNTDPTIPDRDLNTQDMLGYTCLSPRDLGELKKFIQKVLQDLESNGLTNH